MHCMYAVSCLMRAWGLRQSWFMTWDVEACNEAHKPGRKHESSCVLAHCREARKVGREAGERLRALRDKDYEAYLRLATRAKDQRLRTLLAKTDDIISELGSKVCCILSMQQLSGHGSERCTAGVVTK